DIARAFCSDAGARLMRKDADLAERVKFEMLAATGIVPLSVHDSFIVPATQAGRLEEAMERQISSENASNFATTYPTEIPKESSKVVPQYGMEPRRVGGWPLPSPWVPLGVEGGVMHVKLIDRLIQRTDRDFDGQPAADAPGVKFTEEMARQWLAE